MGWHVGAFDESDKESLHGCGIIIVEVFVAAQAWAKLGGFYEFVEEGVVYMFYHFITVFFEGVRDLAGQANLVFEGVRNQGDRDESFMNVDSFDTNRFAFDVASDVLCEFIRVGCDFVALRSRTRSKAFNHR